MQQLVSADDSPTGLAESSIQETMSLDLESYLTRVLAGEVPADWPIEALKAQAIASRSYTLYLKSHARSPDYDLLSSVNDQVFHPKGKIAAIFNQAVRATTGQVLMVNGQPLQAYFHSCCGGMTERPMDVWPAADAARKDLALPGLARGLSGGRSAARRQRVVPPDSKDHPLQVSVKDPYDADCPNFRWNYELSKIELLVLLSEGGHNIADFTDIVPSALTATGRIKTFRFVGPEHSYQIDANELRKVVGYSQLKSTNFRMEENEMEIQFVGKGAGHGVGLCQWGARGMAAAGLSAEEILAHFYPGAELTTAY